MHDWSILVNILKGEKYISVAKVAQYEQHKDNLEKLRRFILKYGSKSLYKEMFNDRKKSTNYCAYIGSVKVNGKKYSVKKCTQEDFYKYLKKTLEVEQCTIFGGSFSGNSVERNRARRLIRENYRFLKDDIRTGYDIIFIARNTINGRKFSDVKKSMVGALLKSKLLKRSEN